ncbi:MAG TPA: hypothetical protein DEV93_03140 [Chloroflexi bacterium]|jgi:uncharacterized protein (TIGR03083 family)|nr:hypothetical protein [Chloroflexota bacterium]
MNKQQYLVAFDQKWQQLLEAARLGLEPPIAACPGWTVGSLVGHMGSVFTFWNKWVRDRPRAADKAAAAELRAERERLLPGMSAWRDVGDAGDDRAGFRLEAMPPGVFDFAGRMQAELAGRLAALDPSEPVWTFFEPDQTAGFVQRRITHETTIHCWDAQAAHGVAQPIETELARDGIDEYVDTVIHVTDPDEEFRRAGFRGERYLFRGGDAPAQWLLGFASDGLRVSREHGPADLELNGPVSDLLLFMYGRVGADKLQLTGDAALVGRWPELTGTF